jgi:lipoate-protein ligase A
VPSDGVQPSASGSPTLPSTPALHWHVLEDGANAGAVNMARDHALAEVAPDGCGIVRFYRWATPTLSFGRHEPVRGRYVPAEIAARGWQTVRRPTGGRAVLHHRELTYSVIVPARASGGPRALYAAVHQGIARGLQTLGVQAAVVPPDRPTPYVDAGPCFGLPAPGELEVAGRKLVGSAQARLGSRLLQHGSILIDDDQQSLALTGASQAASLREVLGAAPPVEVLIAALTQGLSEQLGGLWGDATGPAPDPAQAEAALLRRYVDPEWTWRR